MSDRVTANVRTVASHYDQFADLFDRGKAYVANDWQQPPPIMNIGYWAKGATTAREAQVEFVHHAAARLPILTGKRLLDVGCGLAGPASILAAEYGAQVDGITIVEQQVAWGTKFLAAHGIEDRVRVHLGSAMDIPFPDGSFDVVFCLEAAHCFVDKPRFLAEARRVLRPDGTLLVIDITATSRLPLVNWQPALRLELVTAADWRRLLESADFTVDVAELIGHAVYPGYRRWLAQTADERRQAIVRRICPPGASPLACQLARTRAWFTEFALCRSVLPIGSQLGLREYALFLAQRRGAS